MEFIIPWIMTVPKDTNLLSAYGLIILYSIILYLFFHPDVPIGYKLYYIDNTTVDIVSDDEILSGDILYGSGFYGDEGGYNWANKNAKLVVYNKFGDERRAIFLSEIFTGEQATVWIYCNNERVGKLTTNQDGIACEVEIVLKSGENEIEIVTDAQRIENSSDTRALYMRLASMRVELME